MLVKSILRKDVAPIIVELVNQSDRFVILKAAKTLAKINEDNDTHINISLGLYKIGLNFIMVSEIISY
jgi:hypothetical protein